MDNLLNLDSATITLQEALDISTNEYVSMSPYNNYTSTISGEILIVEDDPVEALDTLTNRIEKTIKELKDKDLLNNYKVIEVMSKLNKLSLQ